MSLSHGSSIVRDGLVLHLDAANPKSYPGSGTSWVDLSGNGNHVTLYNGVTFSNGSLIGDGVDAYGRTNSTLDLTSTNAITVISAWKMPTTTSTGILYEHTVTWNVVNSGYGGFGLGPNSQGSGNVANWIHVQVQGNVGYGGRNTPTPDSTAFQHYAAIHDFTATALNETVNHINGALVTTTGGTSYTANNTGNFGNDHLYLWTRGGTASFNSGSLSFLKIYNRRLTLDEIKIDFEATRGRYGI